MQRWHELRKQGLMNIEQIGGVLREEYPERFGHLLRRSAYIACLRECENEPLAAQVEASIQLLPRATDLPPVMDQLTAPYADCLLLSDIHIPFHDETLLAESLLFARANKLRRVVCNGDTLDLLGFSSFDNLTSEDVRASLARVGEFFIAALDHGVTELHLTTGNHEHRFERKVGGALGFRELLGHVYAELPSRDRIRVTNAVTCTNRFWLTYTDTPDGIDWQIHHQQNYRQKRLSTAMDLALKVTNCHTATGHEHHYGVSISENGKWWAVNLPTCQAEERTEYIQRRKRVSTQWVRGFGWLIDGVPGLWWNNAPEVWKQRRLAGPAKKGRR